MTLTLNLSNFEMTNFNQNKMANYKCLNHSEGCPIKGKRENITTKHEFRCQFRIVCCPKLGCDLTTRFKDVLNHLAEVHEITSFRKIPLINKTRANYSFAKMENDRYIDLHWGKYFSCHPFKSDGKKFLLQILWSGETKQGMKM